MFIDVTGFKKFVSLESSSEVTLCFVVVSDDEQLQVHEAFLLVADFSVLLKDALQLKDFDNFSYTWQLILPT